MLILKLPMKILSLFKKHTWQSLSLKLIISRKSVSVKIFTALLFQTLANLVLELLAPSPARSVKHAHKSASHWFFFLFFFFVFWRKKRCLLWFYLLERFLLIDATETIQLGKTSRPAKSLAWSLQTGAGAWGFRISFRGFENVQFLWFCFYFTAWWLLIIACWLLTIIVRALM